MNKDLNILTKDELIDTINNLWNRLEEHDKAELKMKRTVKDSVLHIYSEM